MAVLQDFKCPCCDGAIEFNSNVQKMKCPYCDSEFEIAELQAYADEQSAQRQEDMTWETEAGGQWQEGEAEGLRVYTCNTCGGQIVTDETTGATECPFCGNPVVMTGQFAGDLKPDLVIPFKLDKKAAMAALEKFYKGKVLLPKVFKTENHVKEVKGLYVPVWLYDTDADADVQYKATKTRTWADSQYTYRETSYYSVSRSGDIGFENVPVDGSTKMDDTMMESLEPYDISQAVDFQTAYLSGFLADKYDVDAQTSMQRANDRIKSSTEAAFAATVTGYSTVTTVSSNIRLGNSRVRYALYPVWLLHTKWRDQSFLFGVNGQTGKVAGNLPMHLGAFFAWLIGVAVVAAGLIFGAQYLFWMS